MAAQITQAAQAAQAAAQAQRALATQVKCPARTYPMGLKSNHAVEFIIREPNKRTPLKCGLILQWKNKERVYLTFSLFPLRRQGVASHSGCRHDPRPGSSTVASAGQRVSSCQKPRLHHRVST